MLIGGLSVGIALAPGLALSALAISLGQRRGWSMHPAVAACLGGLVSVVLASWTWNALLTATGFALVSAGVIAAATLLVIKFGPHRARISGYLLVATMVTVLVIVVGGGFFGTP
jgi:hypothetical protein